MTTDAAAPFIDRLRAALTTGSSVRTRVGFFAVRVFAAYAGRNPRTGATVDVPAKRLVFFAPSDELSHALFGDAVGETGAEAEARITEDGVAPAVDVACSDEELRALVASLHGATEADVPRLGHFVVRTMKDDPNKHVVQLRIAEELVAAVNAR